MKGSVGRLVRGLSVTTVLAVGALVAIPGGASAAPPPPTLENERLVAAPSSNLPATTLSITATCNPSGTSTITFSASGPASAEDGSPPPYSGNFTENGTITIGPQTGPSTIDGFPDGPVTGFTANFTIDDGSTVVTGTKSLGAPLDFRNNRAICVEFTDYNFTACGALLADGYDRSAGIGANYSATIETSRRKYRDAGVVGYELEDLNAQGPTTGCTRFLSDERTFLSNFRHPKPTR